MTLEQRLERDLPVILDEIAMGPYPDYIDDVLSSTAARRQRPTWTFPERWLPVELVTQRVPTARLPWRQVGLLALIAALLAAALAIYVGSRAPRLPAPFGPAANGDIPFESNGDIFVGDPVTGGTRIVVGGPEHDWGASYSPDGTLIGFLRDVTDATFDIYVVRADGSDLRRLTAQPISNRSWAQWVPDSRHIATIQTVETSGCPTTICLTNQLDFIDVSGKIQTVARAEGMDYVQFRPPDGNELLYRARVHGKWGLFTMQADGANVRTLAQPDVPGEMDMSFATANYSTDGAKIFYQHGDAGGCCRLWVMQADGTGAHEFRAAGPAWDGQPIVSPDGTWISYWHNPDVGPTHGISVVRADGQGSLVETGPPLPAGASWMWAPDSSRILMFSNESDIGNAFLLDPAGGPFTTVPWTSGGDLDWQRVALPPS